MFRQLRTEKVAVAPADQLRGGGAADQLRKGLRGAGVYGVFIFNADKVRGIPQKFFEIARHYVICLHCLIRAPSREMIKTFPSLSESGLLATLYCKF